MRKRYPPTIKEQQIIQQLLGSDDKGKRFFQVYCNQSQTSSAINAFSLLTYTEMVSVTSSLNQLQTAHVFDEHLASRLDQCYRQCQGVQSSLWMIDHQRNQRNCNCMCLLMCLGIFVSCLFSLWEMVFVTSVGDVVTVVGELKVIGEGDLVSGSANFIYFSQKIIYIVLKLVSGFWAFFGFLLSSFCLCGCLPHYYNSIKTQHRQRQSFKQRLIKNRQQQSQQISIKND